MGVGTETTETDITHVNVNKILISNFLKLLSSI